MLAEFDWNALLRPNVLATILALMIPMVGAVALAWRSIEKTKSENSLKRTLAERGMTAADIERVLAAKGPKDDE